MNIANQSATPSSRPPQRRQSPPVSHIDTNRTGAARTGKESNQAKTKRIACVWLPEWPIQRLVAAKPEYRHCYVVLFRIDARQGKQVAAASPLARHAGVRINMPLNEASSLLRTAAATNTAIPCPADPQSQVQSQSQPDQPKALFHIFEHDPDADLNALKQLVERLEKFSPVVGIEQDFRQIVSRKKNQSGKRFEPSSVLLDVTGLSQLFGGYQALATALSQHCHQHDYHTRIAIANTQGLAWGASHFSRDCRFDQPQIIPDDDLQIQQHLPVMALRIDTPTCQTLQRLGIETVGQLLTIDRGDLRSRLGNDLIRRLDQFNDNTDEPIIACRKPPQFAAKEALDYPTHHRQTIAVVVDRLITELCSELKSRQLGSLQWKFRLLSQQQQHKTGLEFRVSLFQPTATADHVIPLASMQLEQALLTQTASELNVSEIIVEVASCVLLVQQQRQLFDENPRLDRQALSHLINRLSNRLGNDNVVYPTFRSGAQPELSFQFRPLVDPHRKRLPARPVRTSHVLGRPLRLLTSPAAVSIQRDTNQERELAFRKPQTIAFNSGVNQSRQKIVQSWGPERIETGWWRGSTVQRDYWCILTETGIRLWVFFDWKQKQWFMHGEF